MTFIIFLGYFKIEQGEWRGFYIGAGFPQPLSLLKCLQERVNVMMRLFKKKDEAVKNWRSRAMLIDLHKTRLIIVYT